MSDEEVSPQSLDASRVEAAQQPEQVLETTEDIGEAAVGETATQIPVTASEAIKFDAEKQANQSGWEETANELNKRRPTHEKILGKNETTAEGVMQDEALRINAEIDEKLPYEVKNAERFRDEGFETDKYATTPQELFNKLRGEEAEEMNMGRPRLRGPHRGGEYSREPIFNPKGEYASASASEIKLREERTTPISEKVIEALEQGDIGLADEALKRPEIMFRFSSDDWDTVTMQEHITPHLRALVGNVFRRGDSETFSKLLETKNLSDFLYPGMAKDAGVSEIGKRQKERFESIVTHKATKAIEELGPHLSESDSSGRQYIWEELQRRFDLLSRAGVMTRDELAKDWVVRGTATRITLNAMADRLASGYDLRLPSTGWKLLQLGVLDLDRLAQESGAKRIALMEVAKDSKALNKKAEQLLRTNLLGEEEAKAA